MSSEEDLIARLRRSLRQSSKHIVLYVNFGAFGFIRTNKDLLQLLQNSVQDVVQRSRAATLRMMSGDLFVFIDGENIAGAQEYADAITAAAFADRDIADGEDEALVRIFRLPADYAVMRACADSLLEKARGSAPPGTSAASVLPSAGWPAAVSGTPAPEGPLNATVLVQIEGLLEELDMAQYLRTQTIFEIGPEGWYSFCDEYFTDIARLRRDKFPKVTIGGDERLFLELCGKLDRLAIRQILNRRLDFNTACISVNILVETAMSAGFAEFTARIPKDQRGNLMVELHRADLFQDFAAGRSALVRLHDAGFVLAIDGLTLDLLPFINLDKLGLDIIKVQFHKDQVAALRDPDCIAAIRRLDPTRIVLCRCDTPIALQVGKTLGITRYQGWLIDDQVGGSVTSPVA